MLVAGASTEFEPWWIEIGAWALLFARGIDAVGEAVSDAGLHWAARPPLGSLAPPLA